jgi:hypothetical protein
MTTTETKSAITMTETEYKAQRKLAAAGQLPTPKQAFKARLAAEIEATEQARAVPPPEPATSTSSTTPTPPANQPGGGRNAMDLDDGAYRAARAAIVRAADGGRVPAVQQAWFGS